MNSTVPAFGVMIFGLVVFYLFIHTYAFFDSVLALGFIESIAFVLFWHGIVDQHVKALEKESKSLKIKVHSTRYISPLRHPTYSTFCQSLLGNNA